MKKITLLLLAAALMGACTTASKYQTTRQSDINALTKSASFQMPKVPVPSFPSGTYNVLDYGADKTGVALSTEAIQGAIDACTNAGGGTVIIPEGIYFTGPLTLKSNVRLYTEKNCFVVFSHREYRYHRTWYIQRQRRLVASAQEEQDGSGTMEETSQRERRYRGERYLVS